jgi:pimeloyl-ACP methyl ester carboxylesterase
MPETGKQVRLPDGRRLGYAEFGDPLGRPVLYFHGFPASRLEARLAHEAALRTGVRLVAADRPGSGLSDFLPERTLSDWPVDVTSLAESLGLGRFAILGVSGGGPYAAACACLMPQRLTAVGIVGGLGPLAKAKAGREMQPAARFSFFLARRAPKMTGILYRGMVVPFFRFLPAIPLALLSAGAPPRDREVLQRPGVKRVLLASLAEAFRQGGRGAVQELLLYSRPWGFDPAAIRARVEFWHGERDATVPVSMGRNLAAIIPGCKATFLPEEGHFSLPVDHAEEILRALVV